MAPWEPQLATPHPTCLFRLLTSPPNSPDPSAAAAAPARTISATKTHQAAGLSIQSNTFPRTFSYSTSIRPTNSHLRNQNTYTVSTAVCSWSLESKLITCIFNLPGTHTEILAKRLPLRPPRFPHTRKRRRKVKWEQKRPCCFSPTSVNHRDQS